MPLQTLSRELATQISSEFPLLQSLNLSNNALRDVRHLQSLPRSLTQLDLGGNRLQALPQELGEWLPELRLLRLRGNGLEALRPLSGCKRLQTLDLGQNRLLLVSDLRSLQSLTQLRHLFMDGNPLATDRNYRREVLGMLPQLQTLDGQQVTAAEKLYAKLQLKTPIFDATSSQSPSPTRLLTPESIRTRRKSGQSSGSSSLRADIVAGESQTDDREDHRFKWDEDDSEQRDSGADLHRLERNRLQLSPPAIPAPLRPPLSAEGAEERRQESRFGSDSMWQKPQEDSIKKSYADTQQLPNGRLHAESSAGQTRETLLQSRVEALEAILAMQDKTMRHALAQFGGQHANSHMILAVNDKSDVVPTVEAAAAVYIRLLAAWRERCVALMVQARSTELASESTRREHQQQQIQAREALARWEEQQEVWRQCVTDLEAQRDLEIVAARHAQDERSQANLKAVQAVRSLALEREKLRLLGESVVRFTGGLVREKVEQLRCGTTRLAALERRIFFAKEKVELAATLVAHREARLRNSEAALEAERRVWANRLEQMRNSAISSKDAKAASNSGDIKAMMSSGAGGKILRPATETALRSLFHRLDTYDTGLVRSQKLLQTLRRGDPEVLSATGGPKRLAKLVSYIETAIGKLSASGKATTTITWGEFLLFFIPESSVSLSSLIEDDNSAENDTTPTRDELDGACVLCAATKNNQLPSWSLDDIRPGDNSDPRSALRGKDRRALRSLTHEELVEQVASLLTDREHLQRLVLQDAHDLRDRVRNVRREWELKAHELVHHKDALQRELSEQAEKLHARQEQCSKTEQAYDEALLEINRLREEFESRTKEFQKLQQKLETEGAERLKHEQDVWQTELQDARLAHSLLQADHSKLQVRVRQLERDLARQKEALLAHESERVASLEEKVLRRDTELGRLRRERNTILSSLRKQERKLALASTPVAPIATESVASQTTEATSLKLTTSATQTTPASLQPAPGSGPEAPGARMSINEISTPNSLDEQPNDDRIVKSPLRSAITATNHLSPREVNLRLQKLQSLTENLLAD